MASNKKSAPAAKASAPAAKASAPAAKASAPAAKASAPAPAAKNPLASMAIGQTPTKKPDPAPAKKSDPTPTKKSDPAPAKKSDPKPAKPQVKNAPNDRGPAGNTASTTSPFTVPANRAQSGGGSSKANFGRQVASAGSILTKNEATKIAKSTGKTVAQVMARAQDKGQGLGSSLVNNYNRGTLGPNGSNLTNFGGVPIGMGPGVGGAATKALSQLQALEGLKMGKGQVYMGSSTTTTPGSSTPGSTTYNPIVATRGMVGAGGGTGGGGGGNGGNVQNNGEFENIKTLFQQQMDAAQTKIDELSSRQAETINGLTANFDAQLAASQASADQRIQGLNDLMLQQQNQAASTQALLQQQAQAAQTAYQEQLRQSDALGRAYVPTLNQSAASAVYGDQRTGARQDVNNSLGGLSIVSGLGTIDNPLVGLQLA